MAKYYYDCPIKAIYMMREFGIEIYILIDGDQRMNLLDFELNGNYLHDALDELDYSREGYKFYVAKESESIFEPKDDDFGIDNLNQPMTFNDGSWFDVRLQDWIDPYTDIKITMRDTKHFFQPIKI